MVNATNNPTPPTTKANAYTVAVAVAVGTVTHNVGTLADTENKSEPVAFPSLPDAESAIVEE